MSPLEWASTSCTRRTQPPGPDEDVDGTHTGDYARLIQAPDRRQFYRDYRQDIRPTTDDRPFFFHTTKLERQFSVAFSKTMLFGNGLSALLTLLGISATLVLLFVVGPLVLTGGARGVRAGGCSGSSTSARSAPASC